MTHQEIIMITALAISIADLFLIIKFSKQKRYEYAIETIILFIVILLFLYYEYFYLKFQINDIVILFALISVLGHSFLGEYLDFYQKSKYFDRFLHFFGTFSFALFTYSIIYHMEKPIYFSKIYVTLFVITLGIAIGVLLEITEFVLDTIIKSKKKKQHGLKDTDFDLIFDVAGATLAGIVFSYYFLYL